ncbi:MAG: hypothetical protein QOF76_590 [Solirubrobacteraceae bacterium]|nr:hypothetical protein [Solirubrobacteraceae bacterium]
MSWTRWRGIHQWRAIVGPGCALAAIAASMLAPAASAAPVPYAYDMDKSYGFVPDPNAHQRVGYVSTLQFGSGTGSVVTPDLEVSDPTSAATPPGRVKIVAVMSRFEWNGGVGDPMRIDAYVSQQNAQLINAKFSRASALITGLPLQFSYVVKDYDPGVKRWFTQATPTLPPISTTVVVTNLRPEVSIDLTPVAVKDGIDVNVYRLSFKAAAPVGSEPLAFQDVATKQTVRPWGLLQSRSAETGETDVPLEPESPAAPSTPASTGCPSARRIVIHLPRSWRRATVSVAGRLVRAGRTRGRLTATIDLRRSTRATVTVSARGIDHNGRKVRQIRHYHLCHPPATG